MAIAHTLGDTLPLSNSEQDSMTHGPQDDLTCVCVGRGGGGLLRLEKKRFTACRVLPGVCGCGKPTWQEKDWKAVKSLNFNIGDISYQRSNKMMVVSLFMTKLGYVN